MIVDLRAQQKPGGPDPKCGLHDRRGALVLRQPEAIDSICLHQTAVRFGARASDIAAERGDKQSGRWRRALGVHAHVTAFDDGAVCPSYPLRAYVWHGNGANGRSIGLEVEGVYNGRPGGSDAEPTDETIQTAREAMRWIVEAARAEGITIRYVLAHRQFSDSRRADPGWTLWRQVALWADDALGLATIPTLTDTERGVGHPIPREWDPRQSGGY